MRRIYQDAEIWKERWYRVLSPVDKIFWRYLLENCDCAGVWPPDFEHASFCVGSNITEQNMAGFNEEKPRVVKLKNGKYWVVNFIRFQQKKLSRKKPSHKNIYESIERNNLPYTDQSFDETEPENEQKPDSKQPAQPKTIEPEQKPIPAEREASFKRFIVAAPTSWQAQETVVYRGWKRCVEEGKPGTMQHLEKKVAEYTKYLRITGKGAYVIAPNKWFYEGHYTTDFVLLAKHQKNPDGGYKQPSPDIKAALRAMDKIQDHHAEKRGGPPVNLGDINSSFQNLPWNQRKQHATNNRQ